MQKREADSSLILRHYLHKYPADTSSFEMKDTRGKDYLPFDAVEDNQLNYALAIKSNKGVLIRVPGTSGEPDYIYLRNCPARIAIKYPKAIYVIDAETFIMEKKCSKRKSLTAGRAEEIAINKIVL